MSGNRRQFAADVIFPNQILPETVRHLVAMNNIFADDGMDLAPQHALKALAMRDLLLGTYKEHFPIQEVLDPRIAAQQIAEDHFFPFFFVVGSQIIGTASVMPDGHGGAEFGRTAVRRDNWGLGIGDLLLNARFSFARIYAKPLNIHWFYCHARAANSRIQEIWLNSPHHLIPVGIAPYYRLDMVEFLTIFIRHFGKVHPIQAVECLPDLQSIVMAVCEQFQPCDIAWAMGQEEVVKAPDDYHGYYHKLYISQLNFDVSAITDDGKYTEVWCPTTLKGAHRCQKALLDAGFIPNAFYPGFNGQAPYLTFGRLPKHTDVRAANFPAELRASLIGQQINKIYTAFCDGVKIHKGDPFV